MSKSSKTEQEALYKAIIKLSGEKDQSFFPHLCSLYDKLSGVKYAHSKNTFEFVNRLMNELN